MPARNELALSSDWRITKSSVKAIDMANALQSLRRLAGGLGVEAEIIRYATDGESKSNKELIEIDTHYATQSQPIRDSEFDILAGAMLHECGHYKIDSIDVPINYLDAKEGVYSPEGIGAIGEEIVADRYIQQKSKVYNRYIHAVRNAEKYKGGDISDEDYENLLGVWLGSMVYGKQVDWTKWHLPMAQAYGVLVDLERQLSKDIKLQLTSTLSRTMHYKSASLKISSLLNQDKPISQPDREQRPAPGTPEDDQFQKDRKQDGTYVAEENYKDGLADAFDERQKDITEKKSDKDNEFENSEFSRNLKAARRIGKVQAELETRSKEAQKELSPQHSKETISEDLSNAISEAVENANEDITEKVKGLLGSNWSRDVRPIVVSNEKKNYSKEIPPNPRIERELQYLTRVRNSADNIWLRPEERGKLAGKYLYRHKIDGKTYRRKIKRPDQRPEFVILLDASGSMYDEKDVYMAAAAVHIALPKAPIYTYNQLSNVEIKRVENFGRMKWPGCDGGTPSGEAILATVSLHPTASILHFTDGEPNGGRQLQNDVYKVIGEKFLSSKLLNIIFSHYGDGHEFGAYGFSSEQIKNIHIKKASDFSGILLDELRRWFKL